MSELEEFQIGDLAGFGAWAARQAGEPAAVLEALARQTVLLPPDAQDGPHDRLFSWVLESLRDDLEESALGSSRGTGA